MRDLIQNLMQQMRHDLWFLWALVATKPSAEVPPPVTEEFVYDPSFEDECRYHEYDPSLDYQLDELDERFDDLEDQLDDIDIQLDDIDYLDNY